MQIFCFLLATRSGCVAQADLELLGSSYSSTSPSLMYWDYRYVCLAHPFTSYLFFEFWLFIYLFSDRVSLCHPDWGAVVWSQLTATSTSLAQAIFLPQPPKKLELQACTITPGYFLCVLVVMGFLHVGQPGFELLTSSDPPDSASQSAGITGVSYRPWPIIL